MYVSVQVDHQDEVSQESWTWLWHSRRFPFFKSKKRAIRNLFNAFQTEKTEKSHRLLVTCGTAHAVTRLYCTALPWLRADNECGSRCYAIPIEALRTAWMDHEQGRTLKSATQESYKQIRMHETVHDKQIERRIVRHSKMSCFL